jgi:hypothetical protein
MTPGSSHIRSAALAVLVSACGPTAIQDGEEDTTDEGGDPDCPELVWSGGILKVESADQALALPRYTQIDGHLWVSNAAGITDLSFLECLREVNGDLIIRSLPDLQSLAGLEQLETVYHQTWPFGTLSIFDNPKLDSVDALANLHYVSHLRIGKIRC